MQGSRVLLVEVQALTASSVIGAAGRKVKRREQRRVAMIIAVLEKRAEMRLAADDVFVNVPGGVKVIEPAMILPSRWRSRRRTRSPASRRYAGRRRARPLGGRSAKRPTMGNPPPRSIPPRIGHAIVPHMVRTFQAWGMSLHEVRRLAQALSDL